MEAIRIACGLLGGAFLGALFAIFAFMVLGIGKEMKEKPKKLGLSGLILMPLFAIPAGYILLVVLDSGAVAMGFGIAVAWSYLTSKER